MLMILENMEKDIIFIDTNVFVSEHYFLEGNRINKLLELAEEGYINILWPEIAYNEVKSHIVRDMSLAFKYVCCKDNRVLRNHPAFVEYCKNGKDSVCKIALQLLESFKVKSHAFIIPTTYCDNVGEVFDKYFSKKKPFGIEKKKDEFPDAFIIQSLEKYCKKNSLNQKIKVLTTDRDYVDSSSYLTIVRDYGKYISEKLATKEEFDQLYEEMNIEASFFKNHWQEEIEKILNIEDTYSEYCNYGEVSFIEVECCDIDLDCRDLYILNNEENAIIFDVYPTVNFSVKIIYHDTSEAWYDKEYDEWYGDEWKEDTLNLSVPFESTIRFDKTNTFLSISNSDYSAIIDDISQYR